MRRILAVAAVAGVLMSGAAGAWAQSGSSGSGGGDSSSGSGRNPRVGPNAKLGSDAHDVSVAAKYDCKNGADYTAQAKVKQGGAISKGTATIDCAKGTTKTFTVKTTDADNEFTTGQAEACVAVVRKGSNAKPNPTCRKISVVD